MNNTIEESKANIQETTPPNNIVPEINLIPTNEEQKVVDEVKIKEEEEKEEEEEIKQKMKKESSDESQRHTNEVIQSDIKTIPQDEYLNFSDNEAYHEKVLALLKINNNKVLNNIYKRNVPSISKNALLMYDLTLASSVCFISFIIESESKRV